MSKVDFGTPASMLHRTEGPETSVEAAYSIDTTRMEQIVFNAICGYGAGGCIADDLVTQFKNIFTYSSITARPSALERKGLIVRGPDKRRGHSNRQQFVMRETKWATR
jgi:hypothetical protein